MRTGLAIEESVRSTTLLSPFCLLHPFAISTGRAISAPPTLQIDGFHCRIVRFLAMPSLVLRGGQQESKVTRGGLPTSNGGTHLLVDFKLHPIHLFLSVEDLAATSESNAFSNFNAVAT
jgi:hypothetical protein